MVEFVQHFRQYLLGREFTLRTDHGSLVWLKNFKEPEGQLARWLERLAEYNFTVVHRRGSQHNNADALSRLPCNQCGRDNHSQDKAVQEEDPRMKAAAVSLLQLQTHSPRDMYQLQLKDPIIGPVYDAVRQKVPLSPDELSKLGRESRMLLQQWDSLCISDGVLYRKSLMGSNALQLIVPQGLQRTVLKDLHEGAVGGHLGEGKMTGRLKERFYWPGCTEDARGWCRACPSCSTRKTLAPKRRAKLQTLRAGYPMQIVCVDIMGPLPVTEKGSKYVLVAADCFSKWVEAYGIPNQEAVTVAVKLVDEMFCRFSPPEQVHSDQGRQFESELLKETCRLLHIKKTHTTPYRPQGNGMVERFNRTLLDMLAIAVGDHPADWEVHIRKLCFAYNTSVHSSTGYSPFFLMFGRQATIPADLMYPLTQTQCQEKKDLPEYVHKLREGLQEAYALVRRRCDTEHKRQKAIYDKRAHGEAFNKDDLVWLFSPAVPRGKCKKFHHPWKGPFIIIERLGTATYKTKPAWNGWKCQIVHFTG